MWKHDVTGSMFVLNGKMRTIVWFEDLE